MPERFRSIGFEPHVRRRSQKIVYNQRSRQLLPRLVARTRRYKNPSPALFVTHVCLLLHQCLSEISLKRPTSRRTCAHNCGDEPSPGAWGDDETSKAAQLEQKTLCRDLQESSIHSRCKEKIFQQADARRLRANERDSWYSHTSLSSPQPFWCHRNSFAPWRSNNNQNGRTLKTLHDTTSTCSALIATLRQVTHDKRTQGMSQHL